ncbi:MAG: PIN domain-containing protein [Hormoscilla sp. SP12CHS1]|nr:PIN domain-containing protein [Hormoscilla sp. SP12CHS1]
MKRYGNLYPQITEFANIWIAAKKAERGKRFQEENLYISIISYYETKRGLLYANATRKLSKFNIFREAVTVAFIDEIEIVERAAAIHADLRGKGTLLEDTDILIAATAIARDLTLVSHDSDMLRVPRLKLEDWLSTEE